MHFFTKKYNQIILLDLITIDGQKPKISAGLNRGLCIYSIQSPFCHDSD